MDISVAVEGLSDQGVASAIARDCGFNVVAQFGGHGKNALLNKLSGYNVAAQFSPWLVLVDLDNDAPCPGQKRSEWLPAPSNLMCFRIAVREIEAWLLADAEQIAHFLGVSQALIPAQPETLDDPKRILIDLARRSSKRDIRLGLVPREGSGRSIGPTYASDIREFARSQWRPLIAAASAPSLERCILRVRELAARLEPQTKPTV